MITRSLRLTVILFFWIFNIFFIEERILPKRRANILAEIAKNDTFFFDKELELTIVGQDVFSKQPFGQKTYDGTNIETMQRSFIGFFKPILKRRIFSPQTSVFSWQIDENFPDIIIHPAITFGKPHIKGHRIKSELLFDIHTARNATAQEIADEYEIENISLVQQAIDFEKTRKENQKVTLH